MNHIVYTKLQEIKYLSLIEELKEEIKNGHLVFQKALEYSLETAKYTAQKKLDEALYSAFNNWYSGNGWLTNIEDYFQYLKQFSSVYSKDLKECQSLYNKLYHFHWLINQPIKLTSYKLKSLQEYSFSDFDFSLWLDSFTEQWRRMLGNEASFVYKSIQFFITIGWGGKSYISDLLQISHRRIRQGIKELSDKKVMAEIPKNRQRRLGGGRKKRVQLI